VQGIALSLRRREGVALLRPFGGMLRSTIEPLSPRLLDILESRAGPPRGRCSGITEALLSGMSSDQRVHCTWAVMSVKTSNRRVNMSLYYS